VFRGDGESPEKRPSLFDGQAEPVRDYLVSPRFSQPRIQPASPVCRTKDRDIR
jgi:hypothetical protein